MPLSPQRTLSVHVRVLLLGVRVPLPPSWPLPAHGQLHQRQHTLILALHSAESLPVQIPCLAVLVAGQYYHGCLQDDYLTVESQVLTNSGHILERIS